MGLRAYKSHTGYLLTVSLKQQRKRKLKALRCRYADNAHRGDLFTDEKIFAVEEFFNEQKDGVYALSSRDAAGLVPKDKESHHPTTVMIWWGVAYDGVTKLCICEKRVDSSVKVYKYDTFY